MGQNTHVTEINQILTAVQQKSAEIRDIKLVHARTQIMEFVSEFGYDALGFIEPKAPKAPSTGPKIDKYRNPETGETFSGRGGIPAWAGNRENLEQKQFLNPEWVANKAAKKTKHPETTSAVESLPVNSSVTELAPSPMVVAVDNVAGSVVEKIPAEIAQPTPLPVVSPAVIESPVATVVNPVTYTPQSPTALSIASSVTEVPGSEPSIGQVAQAA